MFAGGENPLVHQQLLHLRSPAIAAPSSAGAENGVPCPLVVGTRKPPYEQLLIGMSFGALIVPRTPYTPREQLLTAVVGGAGCCLSPPLVVSPPSHRFMSLPRRFVSFCLPRRLVVSFHLPLPLVPCWDYSTCNPPHEQLLVRLGAGSVLL